MVVRTLVKKLAFLSLAMPLTHCGQSSRSTVDDLNPGKDSNIAAPGLAKTVSASELETLSVLPNTKVPKGLVVYLIGDERIKLLDGSTSFNNWQFVLDLYREVHKINVTDALEPTVGKVDVTDADRMNQTITLVVLFENGAKAKYDAFVNKVDAALKAEMPDYNGTLYLAPMETKKIAPTTLGGPAPTGQDLWVQDFGEFAMAKLRNVTDPVFMVLDTYRNKNRNAYDPAIFSELFGIPLVYMGEDVDNSAQYGGNIEATPDGVLYIGDSVDDPSYSAASKPSTVLDQLKEVGNANAVKIESDWLSVGHVDEFLTFIPSKQACDSTLVYGSPLLGLQTMLEVASPQEYQLFASELATVPIGSALGLDGKTAIPLSVGHMLTKVQIQKALDKFAKNPTGKVSTNINDYDFSPAKLSREVSLIGTGQVFKFVEFMTYFMQNADLVAEFYVWRNLVAEKSILESKNSLLAVESCKQEEVIPQVFLPNFAAYQQYDVGLWSKDSAHLPGMTNAIVLRDHVIFPDPWVQSMRDSVVKTLDKHIGGDNVHFIDDAIYHFNLGEVHCATNVVREYDLDFQF